MKTHPEVKQQAKERRTARRMTDFVELAAYGSDEPVLWRMPLLAKLSALSPEDTDTPSDSPAT